MRKICIAIVSLIPFTAACSSQQQEFAGSPPIADSIMVEVLIELHLAEARANMHNLDLSASKDSVLLQYGISQDDFESNMAFYKIHPDSFHAVYSKALEELSDERFLPIY